MNSSSANSLQRLLLPAIIVIGAIFAFHSSTFGKLGTGAGGDGYAILGLAVGWIGAILVGLLGLAVVYEMFMGRIDLSKLVSEPTGDASMSRFQLLIFTFVIALCLLLITISQKKGPHFPKSIPPGVLGLLGISAGSYVVSKSLQGNIATSQTGPSVSISPAVVNTVEGVAFTLNAIVPNQANVIYEWQQLAAGGGGWKPVVNGNQSTLTYTAATTGEDGIQFRCRVTNESGSSTSVPVTVSVVRDRA